MSSFEKTPQAIEQHFSYTRTRLGVHASNTIGVGLGNRNAGETEFDPLRHSAFDINPWSVMGLVGGNDYVQVVKQTRPMDIHIVKDSTLRHQIPHIASNKKQAMDHIAGEIDDSINAMTDKFFSFEVVESALLEEEIDSGTLRVDARSALPWAIENDIPIGLTFILSDFNGIKFAEGSLENMIAVKVNHLSERRISALGYVSLGNQLQIDGRSRKGKKQIAKINDKLDQQHLHIVDGLSAAGAKVVSVVLEPSIKPVGLDVEAVDYEIAGAITKLNEN